MISDHSRDTSSRRPGVAGRALARRGLAVAATAALLPLTAVQLRPSSAPAVGPALPAPEKPAPGLSGPRPLSFEPNAGQDHPAVRFSTRPAGAHVSFTATEVVVALTGPGVGTGASKTGSTAPLAGVSVLRTSFVGANPAPDVAPAAPLAGKVNYLRGKDPKGWVTDVPTYRSVSYRSLYPGIDLAYDGPEGQLKSTYTVATGADPSVIRWRYEGARSVTLEPSGDLRVKLSDEDGGGAAREVTEKAPVVWQDIDGRRRMVPARYDIGAGDSVGFTLGDYDRSEVLVIDPTLELQYVKVLGGPRLDDYATGIAVDKEGNSYVTGTTSSPPPMFAITPPAIPPTLDFRPVPSGLNQPEAFVTKFDPDGEVIFSTYLGGIGSDDRRPKNREPPEDRDEVEQLQGEVKKEAEDEAKRQLAGGFQLLPPMYRMSIAVDHAVGHTRSGEGPSAYIAGYTESAHFPTTMGAFRERKCFDPTKAEQDRITKGPDCAATSDAFVAKLKPDGSGLVYSTYLGGSDADIAEGIAVDAFGQAYVTGSTLSDDFPRRSAYQRSKRGGTDAFLTKLNPQGSQLVYSTYLGGDDEDRSADVAVDPSGAAYVTGFTRSWDTTSWDKDQPAHGFPTTAGAFRRNKAQENRDAENPRNDFSTDVFVTKMEPDGSALAYSTHLGGLLYDEGRGIAVNTAGEAHVTGWTNPRGDLQTRKIFVTKLNAAGSAPEYSNNDIFSYGSSTSGEDIAVDPEGYAYVGGYVGAGNFGSEQAGYPSVPYVAALGPSGQLISETCKLSTGSCVKPHAPDKKLYWQHSNDKFSAIAIDHPAAAAGSRKAYAAGSIFSPMPYPSHCRDDLPEEVPGAVPDAAFDGAEALRDELYKHLPDDVVKALLDLVYREPLPANRRQLIESIIGIVNPDEKLRGLENEPERLRKRLECIAFPFGWGFVGGQQALNRDVLVAKYDLIDIRDKLPSQQSHPVPTVVSASPDSLARGASRRDVTITGTNFVDGAVAAFSGSGITVHSTRFEDARTLTANVSVSFDSDVLTGFRDVAVSNPSGTAGVCSGCFSVTATAGTGGASTPTGKSSTTGSTTTTTGPTTTTAPATTASDRSGSARIGDGYWLAASDGGIFAFGDAVFRGSTGAMKLARPIVGVAPSPSGRGYRLVAADGGIFAFGDAEFRGSTGAMKLAQPVVGMAPTPSGKGYWLAAADGGIFAFGDAEFRGSTGAMKLARPVVGMAPSASGKGYWLVAADGGIFAFGDAVFRGSTGAMKLNQPIVGMAAG